MEDCPFCKRTGIEVIAENRDAKLILDKYPVSPGHMLVVPKKHAEEPCDLYKIEKQAMLELVERAKDILTVLVEPDGFNVGINIGEPAGQTVEHFHVHVIPRYKDDVEDPTGGVRGVIPSRKTY